MKKTYSAVIILAIIGTHNLAMQLVPSSPWQMLTPGNVKKIMACSDTMSQKSLRSTCRKISHIGTSDIMHHSPLFLSRIEHIQCMIHAAQIDDAALMDNLVFNMDNCEHADALDIITCFHKTNLKPHLIISQLMALYRGDKAIMDRYMSTVYAPATPQTISAAKVTPLIAAANEARRTMVELLLMLKADVNEADHNNMTPLNITTNKEIARMLLACKNIQINKRTLDGKTPLYKAVEEENQPLIDLFLAQPNFIVNEEDENQLTPLHTAAEEGNDKVFKFFLKYSHNGQILNPLKPIHLAAAHGHYNIVEIILAADPLQINVQTTLGETALMLASTYNHAEIVRLLIARGAPVEVADKHSITPLWIASQNNCFDTVLLLIRAKANVNAIGKGKVTPLWKAAQNNHPQIVKILLEHGALVDHADEEGITSLMMASQGEYIEVAKLLLAHGANIAAKTVNGITALNVAKTDEMKQLLMIMQK